MSWNAAKKSLESILAALRSLTDVEAMIAVVDVQEFPI